MIALRPTLALCLCPLLLAGCMGQLSVPGASDVIDGALAQRRTSGMATLTQGAIELQVGAIHGVSQADNCSNKPVELADLERYNHAQVIHLDRPEPCKWVVTLSPLALHDVAYDDSFKPPSLRDYNTVSIALSQWKGFQITNIEQTGMHADVDAIFNYRFTATMQRLAAANIFPRLNSGCAYNVRGLLIQCTRKLPITFVDRAWRLDADTLN